MKKGFNLIYLLFLIFLIVLDVYIVFIKKESIANLLFLIGILPAIYLTLKDLKGGN